MCKWIEVNMAFSQVLPLTIFDPGALPQGYGGKWPSARGWIRAFWFFLCLHGRRSLQPSITVDHLSGRCPRLRWQVAFGQSFGFPPFVVPYSIFCRSFPLFGQFPMNGYVFSGPPALRPCLLTVQTSLDHGGRHEQKKPTWRNTRRYSTTSAYSSTSPPARPGCSLSSHPTIALEGGGQLRRTPSTVGIVYR